MCGRCRQVFNAFQSLTRVEDSINAPGVNMPEVAAAAVEPVTTEPTPDTLETFFAAETTSEVVPATITGDAPDAAPEPVADALFLREEPLALPAAFSANFSLQRTTLVPDTPSQIAARTSTHSAPIDDDKAQENAAAPAPVTAINEVSLEPAIDLSGEGNRLLIELKEKPGNSLEREQFCRFKTRLRAFSEAENENRSTTRPVNNDGPIATRSSFSGSRNTLLD